MQSSRMITIGNPSSGSGSRSSRLKTRAQALVVARSALKRGPIAGTVGGIEWVPYGTPQWKGGGIYALEVDHNTKDIRDGFWDEDFMTFRPRHDPDRPFSGRLTRGNPGHLNCEAGSQRRGCGDPAKPGLKVAGIGYVCQRHYDHWKRRVCVTCGRKPCSCEMAAGRTVQGAGGVRDGSTRDNPVGELEAYDNEVLGLANTKGRLLFSAKKDGNGYVYRSTNSFGNVPDVPGLLYAAAVVRVDAPSAQPRGPLAGKFRWAVENIESWPFQDKRPFDRKLIASAMSEWASTNPPKQQEDICPSRDDAQPHRFDLGSCVYCQTPQRGPSGGLPKWGDVTWVSGEDLLKDDTTSARTNRNAAAIFLGTADIDDLRGHTFAFDRRGRVVMANPPKRVATRRSAIGAADDDCTVLLGNGAVQQWTPCRNLRDAANKVRHFIEFNRVLSGQWTGGEVRSGGRPIAHVSFNGRVWTPDGWPAQRELDPDTGSLRKLPPCRTCGKDALWTDIGQQGEYGLCLDHASESRREAYKSAGRSARPNPPARPSGLTGSKIADRLLSVSKAAPIAAVAAALRTQHGLTRHHPDLPEAIRVLDGLADGQSGNRAYEAAQLLEVLRTVQSGARENPARGPRLREGDIVITKNYDAYAGLYPDVVGLVISPRGPGRSGVSPDPAGLLVLCLWENGRIDSTWKANVHKVGRVTPSGRKRSFSTAAAEREFVVNDLKDQFRRWVAAGKKRT